MRCHLILCAASAFELAACGTDNSADEAPLTVEVTSSAEPTTVAEPAAQSSNEASTDDAGEPEPITVVSGSDEDIDRAIREMCVAFLEVSESPSAGPAALILERLGDNPPPGVAEELADIIESDGSTGAAYEATPTHIAPICGLNPADFTRAG